MKTQTLKELAALAEYSEAANNGTLKEFAYLTDEDGRLKKHRAAGVGVAGVGVAGGGGLLADHLIMKKYGVPVFGYDAGGRLTHVAPTRSKVYGDLGKKIGRDVADYSEDIAARVSNAGKSAGKTVSAKASKLANILKRIAKIK